MDLIYGGYYPSQRIGKRVLHLQLRIDIMILGIFKRYIKGNKGNVDTYKIIYVVQKTLRKCMSFIILEPEKKSRMVID